MSLSTFGQRINDLAQIIKKKSITRSKVIMKDQCKITGQNYKTISTKAGGTKKS